MARYGQTETLSATPTIDTDEFADGDVLGTLMTFTLPSGGANTGVIEAVRITDNDNEAKKIDIIFFDTAPTVAACNAAFAPTDAELAYYIGHVNFISTDYTSLNTNAVAVKRDLGLPFRCASGQVAFYGVLVARETVTYTAATDINVYVIVSMD